MAAGEVRGGKGTGLYLPHLFLLLGDFLGTFQLHLLYFLYLSITLNHLLRAVHLLHSPLSQTFLVLTSSLLDLVASLFGVAFLLI